MTSKHTRTPNPLTDRLEVIKLGAGENLEYEIVNQFSESIGRVWDGDKAAHIVKCVNLHERLVGMLDLFLRSIDYEISVNKLDGDDEGAALKSITRNQVAALLAECDVCAY